MSTLYALVSELGMTMSDVFGDGAQPAPQVRPSHPDDDDGLVTHPDARRVINLASGVRWERLTPRSDPEVEFLQVVYPVGAESCPHDALVTHGGREYGYVTSGRLGVRVGFDEYQLGPGSSIVFDSSSPHRLWTIGREPVARGLGRHRPCGGRPLRGRKARRPGLGRRGRPTASTRCRALRNRATSSGDW